MATPRNVALSIIWLPATLLAGLFQAWRTAAQQRLRAQLSVGGAGLVRYVYGLPVALLLLAAYAAARGLPPMRMDAAFLVLAAAGGLAQVVATSLLIMAFGFRNFVVGTAFSKTEAVQAAVFACLALGERLSALAVAGIVLGVAGVLLLALGGRRMSRGELWAAVGQPAALCGLGAGALFALTAVLVKAATLRLGSPDPVAAALVTLGVVLALQAAMQGAWIAVREPTTLLKVASTWKVSAPVGLLAALGSACWFTGFATAPVALVRIVGQVEVIFTLAFAHLYLGERPRPHEVAGLLIVGAGVVLALLGARR